MRFECATAAISRLVYKRAENPVKPRRLDDFLDQNGFYLSYVTTIDIAQPTKCLAYKYLHTSWLYLERSPELGQLCSLKNLKVNYHYKIQAVSGVQERVYRKRN